MSPATRNLHRFVLLFQLVACLLALTTRAVPMPIAIERRMWPSPGAEEAASRVIEEGSEDVIDELSQGIKRLKTSGRHGKASHPQDIPKSQHVQPPTQQFTTIKAAGEILYLPPKNSKLVRDKDRKSFSV
ncbi:uncharacterized protein MEPE_02561 [Melanopsichium pennsylvanicum]|uniref:Uncharacterized protein n=2 Tax=Melanopsichium pennsylvanicum TaxID=63383 RepID=A0AAJ4XKM7_9BASI|nr:uncharacterized protein BN887_00769 [Melanopsichium pennsylvanicum 4]SNX83853.1 uncharacterized protein MEPE_02561 [Melanopsichium pennsylvanicum]